MNITSTIKSFLVLFFFMLFGFPFLGYSQDCNSYPSFSPRIPSGNVRIKGDLTLIGNNIVNVKVKSDGTTIDNSQPNFNNPYKGGNNNNGSAMGYIDVDGDASTFSSSSASLALSNPGCAKIKYAYLYWTAIYPYATAAANQDNVIGQGETATTAGSTRQSDWNQVKFKVPGGSYVSLTADQVIWNGYITSDSNYANGNTGGCKDTPYVCFKDVTSQLSALTSLNGNYFVANVRAAVGTRTSGDAAGWSLVVIYEDPSLPAKYISVFDGYQPIGGNNTASYSVNGFKTVPSPQPVNANVGVAALEGDLGITGDSFQIKANSLSAYTTISDAVNPANNFFNSTISTLGTINSNRNPNSINTLGYDLDLVKLANPSNGVIPNNETGATLKLTTSGDGYGVYLSTFAIEIIEPKINLLKKVLDLAGNDITGQAVTLGQTLDYELDFQNIGNDAATGFSIRDVLPNHLMGAATIDVSGAPGVLYTINSATGEIKFTIPDNLVAIGKPVYKIKIRVQVSNSCNDFRTSCSNIIQNQAYSTYQGILNNNVITDDPSVFGINSCGFPSAGASNFIVGIDQCKYDRSEVLCGTQLVLTAADGFSAYQWYDANNNLIGTTQSITVNTPGKYKVVDLPNPPCVGITENITVTAFGSGNPNPIKPFADQMAVCPNDGDQLAKIFLCGATDQRLITTSIISATSLKWQKLDETSCASSSLPDCANKNNACTWNQVGTGNDFTANAAGQYRLEIVYQNGCFERFYFNVFKNILSPQYTLKDVVCNSNGSIEVTNVPSGYEFQLMNQTTNTVLVPYQTNPLFPITTAGTYQVLIRQQGVVGGCVFTLSNLGIINRNFQINTIITNKSCNGLGSIRVQALNVNPQYYFSISGTANISQGPLASNDYTFSNLNPGPYTVTVKTDDGCLQTQNVTVGDDSNLQLTALISQSIGCKDGNIQMSATGGKVPYLYAIYSYNGVVVPQPIPAANYQTSVIFDIPIGKQGTYVFQVIDSKNCTALSSPITINLVPDVVYTTSTQNVSCFGGTDGKFIYNITSKNGYSVSFKLLDSNGTLIATNTSGIFSNLPQGNYTAILVESKGGNTCEFPQTFIISQPAAALTASSEIVQPYTCTTTGTIQIIAGSVSGGTAPYTYSINGTTFGNSSVFTGLTSGTFSITVKDAKGCTFVTTPINFPALNPPTDLIFTNTAVTCPAKISNVTLAVTGGNTPFVYEITAPAASVINNGNNNVFNNLAPGTYTFKVTDAKNCTYQENFTINSITPIAVTGTLVSNVKCLGDANGAVNFTVSGFTTNYSYQINGASPITGQTNGTINLTGLTAGIYTISVIDSTTNCTATASVTVSAPSAALSIISKTVNPITCISQGSVTITATGGWGSYQYKVIQPNGVVIGPQSNGVFNNLSQSGNYIIQVTDANGCLVTDNFTLTTPVALSAIIDPTSDFCYDGINASTLVVTASGGQPAYEYNINGGAWQSSNTFSNLTPGNYTLNVRDTYGCTLALPLTQTIAPQLTINAVLTKDLDCSVSPGPDAVITNTITGGYSPFTYQVKINSGSYVVVPSLTYTTSTAGTYQFLVTDAKGCTAESGVITINPIVMPTATTNVKNVSCNGLNNGSVTIVASLGVIPYTYSFNGSAFTSTAIYNNLGAGTYPFVVKDAKGCLFNGSVTVTQPTTALNATATVVPFKCSATNVKQSATITLNTTTGTAPYQYSFDGGTSFSSNNVLTVNDNGGVQTISWEVKDNNGCTSTGSVTLQNLNPPTDLNLSATAISCSVTTATVTATVPPGTGVAPLKYEIISPAAAITSNGTGVFSGLLPDTYVFKVTDANGCYFAKSIVVAPVKQITITGNVISDVLCKGTNTGIAKFIVSGFSGTYSYSVNGGSVITGQISTTITLPNLTAGNYTVVVTDQITGCTATSNIVPIAEPLSALSATYTTVNANCFKATSVVTVLASGGTPGYTYAFVQNNVVPLASDYQASNSVNLDPTTNSQWDVYIKDANGCPFKLDVKITTDSTPTVSASAVGQCLGSGSYTITATGTGIAPLKYSIDNGASYQSGNTFNITTSGNYVVTIKDANGCTATSNTVTVAPKLTLSAVLNKDITCSLPVAAQITLTANGATSSYTYEYSSNGGTSYTSMASNVFNTSTPGNYIFRVTDANGCMAVTSTPIVVTPTVTPVITSVTQTQTIKCHGDSTAALNIVIDTTQGKAPFVIDVHNDTTNKDYLTQTSGLTAGTYTIKVTDVKGCVGTSNITISEPDPINFDLTKVDLACGGSGITLGTINVLNVTGGTVPFVYYITNNFGEIITPYTTISNNEDHAFLNLNYGIYSINVMDKNGCSLTKNITITAPPDDLDFTFAVAPPSCSTGGSVTVTVVSPVPSNSYEFGILEFNTIPYTNTYTAEPVGTISHTFTGLLPQVIYTFVVHDTNTNCYYFKTFDPPFPPLSSLKSDVVSNNVCGANKGSATFSLTNLDAATTSVDYQIYIAFTNTKIGTQGNVPVNPVPPTTLTTPSILPQGQYYIVFTENGGANNGCQTASAIFEIKKSVNDLSVTATVSNQANCNPKSGIITATAKDGTAPYLYSFDGGITYSSSNTFLTNVPGNYTVYAKDANGCIESASIILNKYADPTISTPAPICYDGNPFTINISGTIDATLPGTPTYGVVVNPAPGDVPATFQSSPNFTFNAAGTYGLFIKDSNGCAANVNYVVNPQLQLTTTLTKNLDCTTTPDATITLSASGGNNTYNYAFSTDGGSTFNPMASNVLTTSTTGNYIFRVTDGQNCIATSAFTLDPIPPTVFTTSVTDASCVVSSDGIITVSVTSGVGPFQYELTGGPTTKPFQPSNEFSGVSPGANYIVTVQDARSCKYSSLPLTVGPLIPLSAISVLTTPLSCGSGNITNPATVTVNGQDGTSPYLYSFDGGANYSSTNVYQSYIAATFDVYVKDAKGCIFKLTNGVDIPALDPPTDLIFATTSPVTCIATAEVEITSTTGGVGTLKFETLAPSPKIFPKQTTTTFSGLTPGTYLFQVTDANGCTYQESYEVIPVKNITVKGQLLKDVSCDGFANGEVEFTVSDFVGTYTYSINGVVVNAAANISTISLPNLSNGTQVIDVVDNTTGCTATASVTVAEPTKVVISLDSNIHANCNSGAVVTVSASGGTPSYTYAFVIDNATPSSSDYIASNSAILDPATSLNWDVYVKDNNGCTDKLDVTIASDPNPTVSVPALASDQCTSGGTSYTFTATGIGIAPLTYSIGAGYQSSPVFTVTSAGTYSVTIKDGNGCTASSLTSVKTYPPLNLTPVITALPSCANNDGVITVSASGGSSLYTYSISPNSVGIVLTGNVFSNVPSGSYTVTITDTTTNCTKSEPVTLTPATPVTLDLLNPFTINNVSCNGGSDGTITVNLASGNDNPIYSYEITSPITVGPQNSNVFSGLPKNTYTIKVTSGRNCTITQSATISEPSLVAVSASATAFSCNSNNQTQVSTVTVTASGGTIPYTYSIDGTSYFTTNTFDVVDTGAIQNKTVYVKDAKGCLQTAPITINPLPYITATAVTKVTPIDCINNSEQVTISVTGGSVPNDPTAFTYQLLPSGPTQNGNPVFNLNAPGTYVFQVTDNTTNCYVNTAPYTIAPFNTITTTLTATKSVTCFGDTDGTASLNVTGYSGTYTYEVLDENNNSLVPPKTGTVDMGVDPNPFTIVNLPTGNLIVKVVETVAPFCPAISNVVTIDSPATALVLVASKTADVTCTNDQGEIQATATGGWGGYQFQLINNTTGIIIQDYPSNNNVFSGLSAGNYTVNLKDSKGCIVSQPVILKQPTFITATATPSVSMLTCNGDKSASITVSGVSGGSGSYQYILNYYDTTGTTILFSSGGQLENVFSNLGAGFYSVTVSDEWNCDLTTTPFEIKEPTPIVATLNQTSSLTCTTLSTLTVSASGGVPPYQFSTDGSNFSPTNVFTVGAGTYQYYVKDTNGCLGSISNQITIDPVPALKVNLELGAAVVNCNGDDTAVIKATAEGGLGNYQYTLLDSSGNPIIGKGPQPFGTFSGLTAGTYYVAVQSGDCNAKSAVINIVDPPLLQIVNPVIQTDVLCHGDKNGTITVNTIGGTGIIQFAISPNMNQFFSANATGGFTFTDLAAGTYQVLVQDQAGCFILRNVTINEPAVLDATVANVQQELCKGDKNGQFTVNITGGTQPYFTNLTTIDGTVIKDYTQVSGSAQTYSGLAGGQMYIINIKDKNNCQTGQIAVLNAPADLQISKVDVAYNCTGNVPGNTVTVSIILNSPGNVTYSLDGTNYQSGSVFTNVASGTYTVYVKHDNGCIKTQSVTIDPKTPISANVSNIINATCNGSATGSITVNASGGTSPLQYAISPNFAYQNGNVFNNLKAGTYDIKVKDNIGCEVTLSNNTITEPTVVVVSLNTAVQELCKGDGNGSITVNISGGVSPYQTSIDGVNYNAGQLTYSNLTGGLTYTIYVKDANGCSPTTQFSYALNAAVDLQLSLTSSDQCTGNAPSHTITASVNSALNPSDVSYSLDGTNYQPSNLFPNLTDGTYTVYAKHSNGCIKQQTITIAPKLPVAASVSSKADVICNGSNTGSITVTANAGTPPYQYAISPNFAYGSTNVFNNLVAGTYEIRVKDAIGCEVILKNNTTTITEPTAIIATVTNVVQEICAGDKSGSITITVSGGVSPYSTSLSQNGSYVQDQFTFSNLSGGKTYIVYVKDANNCLVQTSTTLSEPINIMASVTVNYDCTKHTAVVKVNPTVVNDVTYSLDNGTPQTTNIFDNIQPGNHLISVKHNNNQCFNTVSFNVKAIQPLTLTLEQSGINEFTATAQGGSGIYTYTVNGENIGSQNVVKIHHSGTYVVIVTDTNDCTAQQSIEMTFVDVAFPDNFTPNADGYDDTWAPTNTRDYPNLVTDVFDRYGRKIAILRINDSWDGKYHGEPLPTGDYWYIVKLGAEGDNREYVGHFTLYR